jgi:hypothetical protein
MSSNAAFFSDLIYELELVIFLYHKMLLAFLCFRLTQLAHNPVVSRPNKSAKVKFQEKGAKNIIKNNLPYGETFN